MLTGQNFLAKKQFCFHLKKDKMLKFHVLSKCFQVLKNYQTLLIKMDTVHNSIIDPFEFFQKPKKNMK